MPQWWWDHCFDNGTDNTWWYLWGASQVRLVRELKYGPSNQCDYDPPWRAHFFEGRQMLINHVQLKLGYIGKSHWVIHVVIAYLQTQMHIRALFSTLSWFWAWRFGVWQFATLQTWYSGWWFGTCFFPQYMGCHPSHWRICFRGVETTNQPT